MADAAQGDIQALLEEGLRLYGAGQPARALELWYRVLDVEPRHPTALEYVQYVRDNFHVDVREPVAGGPVAPATSPAPPDWSAEVEPVAVPEPMPSVEVATIEPPAAEPPSAEPPSAVELMPAPNVTRARPSVPAPVAVAVESVAVESVAVESVVVASAVAEPLVAEPLVAEPAVVEKKAAPVEPLGAGWGDLAVGDLDLDPVTGKPVQRPTSDDVRARAVVEAPVSAAPEELPAVAMTPLPVETPPADATVVEAVVEAVVPPAVEVEPEVSLSAPSLMAAPDESEAASPWDGHSGITEAVDLDTGLEQASAMDVLLAGPVRRPHVEGGLRSPEDGNARSKGTRRVEAAEPQNELDSLMEGARDLFELGDFSGSLELVEKVLRQDPENAEAHAYLARNETTLLKMYESKLGDLTTRPRVLTSPDEVIWMNLHHRAGFVLSQVDGDLCYEDLAAISGMSRFETFRILAELVQNGVIG